MQELRLVAVSEDGSYAVLVVPGRGGRYSLQIDDRLRAVARGQFSRLAQYEIEVESPLRPKEIQERIRAGESADEIADAAGVPIERVRWFEGPVLAERAYKAQEAQSAMVRRAGDSGPGPTLGQVVTERLTALGTSSEDAHWDSVKRSDGSWQVQLLFSADGRAKTAEWVYDPRRRHATPVGDEAARLSLPESDLPPELPGQYGEATVTPLQPRFGSATGQGPRPPRRVAEAASARSGPQAARRAPEPQAGRPGGPSAPPAPEGRPAQPARGAEAAPAAQAAGQPTARRADGAGPGARQQAAQQSQPPAAEEPGEAIANPAAQRAAAGQGGRRSSRSRRSSVPSWDEIMFGSSRPRD